MGSVTEIVGYSYEADIHCVDCTAKRFPTLTGTDDEGNIVHPVFGSDETDYAWHCDCGVEIDITPLACFRCEADLTKEECKCFSQKMK